MYEDLSQSQIEVLLFIKSEIERQGYPPSVRDICRGVGFSSTSTVHGHLEKLEKNGYIRKDPSKTRALVIIDREENELMKKKQTLDVPILGKVTAGNPILAIENIEDTYPVPLELVEDKDVFMLKIQGESMIDAGILDNDLVLVEKKSNAKNGDIVVALIEDDEATVKRYFLEKDHIRLQPENQFMEPIYSKDVKILGKVIGLYRKF